MVVAGYYEQLELVKEKYPDKIALSVRECANVLGVDIKTVYTMMHRVKDPLPSKKIGTKKVVIPIPSFVRWLCVQR